jgi:hypothetical protein
MYPKKQKFRKFNKLYPKPAEPIVQRMYPKKQKFGNAGCADQRRFRKCSYEPKMGTEAEVQQAESESESESQKLLAIRFYRQQTKSFPTNSNDEERVPYSSAGLPMHSDPSKRQVTTNNVVRYDDGLPDGRLVLQITRCK